MNNRAEWLHTNFVLLQDTHISTSKYKILITKTLKRKVFIYIMVIIILIGTGVIIIIHKKWVDIMYYYLLLVSSILWFIRFYISERQD